MDEQANSERFLLDAVRSGEDDALERLLALHEESLFALCRSILGQAEDAEDAVQETFLRALRTISGFRGDSSVRTWLTRVAVNVCLDWKRARRPVASLSEETLLSEEAFASHLLSASPEAQVLQEQRILEALNTLLPRHRIMFLLKEQEGWTVAEIAAAFHCTQRRIYHELSIAHSMLAEWRERCERKGD